MDQEKRLKLGSNMPRFFSNEYQIALILPYRLQNSVNISYPYLTDSLTHNLGFGAPHG